jgi:hypothetical protein
MNQEQPKQMKEETETGEPQRRLTVEVPTDVQAGIRAEPTCTCPPGCCGPGCAIAGW